MRWNDVIIAPDRLPERHGAIGAYGRGEHLSDKVIRDEIRQDSTHGGVISAISSVSPAFISTSAVAAGRIQRPARRDQGLGCWQPVRLRRRTSSFSCAAGRGVGHCSVIPVAAWLAKDWRRSACDFPLPHYERQPSPRPASVGRDQRGPHSPGAFHVAVLGAIRLPPAEYDAAADARQARPGRDRAPLQRRPSMTERMVVRNLERRPQRVLPRSGAGGGDHRRRLLRHRDAPDRIIDVQFRANAWATTSPSNYRTAQGAAAAIEAIAQLFGVIRAELFRAAKPVSRAGHREKIATAAIASRPKATCMRYRPTVTAPRRCPTKASC